jgi:hypothetical protein
VLNSAAKTQLQLLFWQSLFDMADSKRTGTSSTSKSKRQAKNAAAEDPFATAKVRAIFDPEQTDLVNAKLDEIQSTGATVTIAASVEGSIERIISVGGSPETVGQVCIVSQNC